MINQNTLEGLATKLLKGEDIIINDTPDYCEGIAMSRNEFSLTPSKESEPKLYDEYNSNGFHVRSWNKEDYTEEVVSNNGMERHSAYAFDFDTMDYIRSIKEISTY